MLPLYQQKLKAMGNVIEKIEELDYNQVLTLKVIFGDSELSEFFKEEFPKADPTILLAHATDGKLNAKIGKYLLGMFDGIICTKPNYVDKYKRLTSENAEPVANSVAPKSVPTKEKTNVTSVPTKIENNKVVLPRRYGKVAIEADIAKQGGKATKAQKAALAVNNLRNLYVKLNTKLINDMLTDEPILNDEDYANILSAITLIENRLKPVVKKK